MKSNLCQSDQHHVFHLLLFTAICRVKGDLKKPHNRLHMSDPVS